MLNESHLKKRIKSINMTNKICQAMRLISIIKLKKINQRIDQIKIYYQEVYDTFHYLLDRLNDLFIFQAKVKNFVNDTIWIVVNSDLGFCSGYNQNLNNFVKKQISKNDKIILIGTRRKNCFPEKMIEKIYKDIDVDFSYNDARNIGINLLLKFNNHQIRSIKIAYMKFINNLHFKPEILTLLPLESQKKAKSIEPEIEFEPNLKVVLEEALPLYVCTVIYGTVIESKLSEYSMRYLATENAINNAEEIKNKLLIQYNKIRQNKITQELSEVTVNLNLDQN